MKIIKIPYDTRVKCEICGCEYEFDKDDICISQEILKNLDGEIVKFPTLYVVCPFCGNGHKLEIEKKEK